MLGNPSRRNFEGMVHANIRANCPVTPENIPPKYELFGNDLAGLQGKTVQSNPECMVMDYIQIPRDFIHMHKFVTFMADIIFVNNLPFVITFG